MDSRGGSTGGVFPRFLAANAALVLHEFMNLLWYFPRLLSLLWLHLRPRLQESLVLWAFLFPSSWFSSLTSRPSYVPSSWSFVFSTFGWATSLDSRVAALAWEQGVLIPACRRHVSFSGAGGY